MPTWVLLVVLIGSSVSGRCGCSCPDRARRPVRCRPPLRCRPGGRDRTRVRDGRGGAHPPARAGLVSYTCLVTRTERLVNLVICLLSTRRFLTAAQIAATVPGYEHDADGPPRARGVPAQVRAGQGRAARPGRAAGDRHRQRRSTPSPATASPGATTRCPTSTWSPTRPPRSASRPGCGSTPGWPRRPRRGCSSCAPPASTSTCRPPSGWSRWSRSTRRSARCRPRPGSAGRSGSTTARPEDDAAPDPAAAAVGRGLLARPVVRGRATTWTATRPAASGCRGWSARSTRSAQPGAVRPAGRRRPDRHVATLVRPGRAPEPGHGAGPAGPGGRRAALGRAGRARARTATGLVLSYADPDGFARWLVGLRRRRGGAGAGRGPQGDDRPAARPGGVARRRTGRADRPADAASATAAS